MVRKAFVIFAILLAFPALAKNLHSEFSSAWAERQGRYETGVEPARAKQEAAIKGFAEATEPAEVERLADEMLATSSQYGYVLGQLETIDGFNKFIARKPSPERAEIFMQERIAELQRKQQTQANDFEMFKRNKPSNRAELFKSLMLHAMLSGALKGETDETLMIDQNLSSYFRAKGSADAKRREARLRLLGAIAAAGQTQQQTMRSVTCNKMGSHVTCTEF